MKRLLVGLAVAATSLVLTSAPLAAGGIYAGPRQWFPGESASSAWGPNWLRNEFATYGSGYDKTVTFIDNRGYHWHGTVRNTSQTTTAYPPFDGTYKAHCKAHSYGFHGSCTVR